MQQFNRSMSCILDGVLIRLRIAALQLYVNKQEAKSSLQIL